jgi:pimeloyl-ACP methyl ester carboxylesterase
MKEEARMEIVAFGKYDFDHTPLKIAVYRWGSGKGKKVLLMHGWGGTGLGFQYLIGELVREGYDVIAYDAPAHGASEGKRTNLVQWMHVLGQFLRREEPVFAVIGHSVGALESALTLARTGNEGPKLVLAGPPLSAPSFFQDTFELFRIRPKVISKVYGLVRTRLKDDLLAMDLRHCMDMIAADRILLIYDGRDELVRSAEIETFLAENPGLQSVKIRGEGHFRILKNPEAVREIVLFLGDGR